MSTYDRLLECADTCIQENGFEGFSYADLAKTLGIRKASIHHHFPTKIDLGLAYCEKNSRLYRTGTTYSVTPEWKSSVVCLSERIFRLRAKRADVRGLRHAIGLQPFYTGTSEGRQSSCRF